jgi:Protein of unknown function (DUF3485)
MSRHLPIALAIVLIVGLTVVEAKISDRFQGSNLTAERFSELLALIPLKVGDWVGEDLPVDDEVRQTAGAVGYVSRSYRNAKTGERVGLWLIVGHSRDVCRHTPNICYPASGFKVRAENNSLQSIDVAGLPPAEFWTNTFLKEDSSGREMVRVFWAWYRPQADGVVKWEAPTNPRWAYGNARALFKLYFTESMRDSNETTDRSSCLRFADVFLPVVDKALGELREGPGETPTIVKPATSAPSDAQPAEAAGEAS